MEGILHHPHRKYTLLLPMRHLYTVFRLLNSDRYLSDQHFVSHPLFNYMFPNNHPPAQLSSAVVANGALHLKRPRRSSLSNRNRTAFRSPGVMMVINGLPH